jgi:hypothetical protein
MSHTILSFAVSVRQDLRVRVSQDKVGGYETLRCEKGDVVSRNWRARAVAMC